MHNSAWLPEANLLSEVTCKLWTAHHCFHPKASLTSPAREVHHYWRATRLKEGRRVQRATQSTRAKQLTKFCGGDYQRGCQLRRGFLNSWGQDHICGHFFWRKTKVHGWDPKADGRLRRPDQWRDKINHSWPVRGTKRELEEWNYSRERCKAIDEERDQSDCSHGNSTTCGKSSAVTSLKSNRLASSKSDAN